MKITKANYKGIVKKLKTKNSKVFTSRGTKLPAQEAIFKLARRPCGKYTLLCTRKR